MGYLKNARFYLGGPIEHSKSTSWRIEPKKVLVERFGINLFDPFDDPKQIWAPKLQKAREEKNYDEMTRIAKLFCKKDLQVVSRSDAYLGYLPEKIPTTGTTHEILNSNADKKPVLLVADGNK